MTNVEYLQELLDDVTSRYGADAPVTRALREQLRSMKAQPKSAGAMFLVGGQGRNQDAQADQQARLQAEEQSAPDLA
jgi:uncharacterized protein involved in exopolysaccharide biosynthesis